MNQKIFKDMAEEVRASLSSSLKTSTQYQFVPFTFDSSSKTIACVDAGQCTLIATPSVSVEFIRIAALFVKENKIVKRKKSEVFAIIKRKNESIEVSLHSFSGNDEISQFTLPSFSETDGTLVSPHTKKVELHTIALLTRKLIERYYALLVTSELSTGDMIVCDGDLKSTHATEEELLAKLYQKAASHNVLVTALAKTCDLTSQGTSVVGDIQNQAPAGSWVTHHNQENQAAFSFFTKLHPRSEYIFKLDIADIQAQQVDITKVCSLLANQARDPAFLGYPYALVATDKHAKVAKSEKEFLTTMFLMRTGLSEEELQAHRNALNAHDLLDQIA